MLCRLRLFPHYFFVLILIVIFLYLCFNGINRIFNFNYRRFLMHFVQAKRLLSKDNGMNIYRGCSHGCIYCDSRSRCYGFTHAFEDIEVKENAPELLEKALRSKRQKCMIGTGAMCDPYLHLEERLLLTRRCLELIDRYEFGVAVQTKSARILRDFDLLTSINEKAKAIVQIDHTHHLR